MRQIVATPEQVQYVKEYLEQGFSDREDFAADYHQKLFGLQAEVIICDLIGHPRPVNTGTHDGGFDITWKGKKWDVKTELRTVSFKPRKFAHNLSGWQVQNSAEGFIFVSYNRTTGVFEICGMIEKPEFLLKALYFKEGEKRKRSNGSEMIVKGQRGMYEIKHTDLHEFNPGGG